MLRFFQKFAFLSFVAILVLAWPQQSDSKTGKSLAVVFSPNGEKRLIHQALIGEIKKARKSVDVAIFTFTSRRLAAALKEKAKTCRVRVIFEERSAKKISISQHKDLIASGVQVKLARLPGTGYRAAKFHHKFCVVDQKLVMTGSFNWTVGADEINHENLLFVHDKPLAKTFTKEFERLWNDKNLCIPGK